MYVCMYVCVRAYACMCAVVRIFISASVHTGPYICMCEFVCIYVCLRL